MTVAHDWRRSSGTLSVNLGRGARSTRSSPLAKRIWWIPVAGILVGSVVFHSGLDPADRFAARSGASVHGSLYYRQIFGSFMPADIAVMAFAYVAGLYRLRAGQLAFSRRATGYAIAIALAVAAGTAVGLSNGTTSPYGDWRDLMIGALFAFGLWSTVLREPEGAVRLARLLVAVVSGYGLLELASFATGSGAVAFYGRTPTANHATLEYMVAAAAISVTMLAVGRGRRLWWLGLAVSTAVVVLSFRRYAWVELATVFAVLMLVGAVRRRYLVAMALVAVVAAIAMPLAGGASLDWGARLASLDPEAGKSQNDLAATNQGHIDDIRDGLDQLRRHPLLGLGVGITYIGKRTVTWKGAAGMVHNGLVEVWIKFGLYGAVLYVVAYVAAFRGIWRRRSRRAPPDLVALAAGAALFAGFVITMTAYGWTVGVPETSILTFTLLGLAYPRGRRATPPPRAGERALSA